MADGGSQDVAISVVIPAFNDARLLRGCLAALALQTRPAGEIIVVDNGSTDDTAEVARSAGATVLRQPLRGIFPAASLGFDAASGGIIARLDADSIPPRDWLESMEESLASASTPSAVTGPGEFYGAGRLTRWFGRYVYVAFYFRLMGLLLGHPPVFGSNFAMHREVWLAVRASVHRDLRHVHDDMDLSIHIPADMTVLYDPLLVVGVSARPFASLLSVERRIRWACMTLVVNRREKTMAGWLRRVRRSGSRAPRR